MNVGDYAYGQPMNEYCPNQRQDRSIVVSEENNVTVLYNPERKVKKKSHKKKKTSSVAPISEGRSKCRKSRPEEPRAEVFDAHGDRDIENGSVPLEIFERPDQSYSIDDFTDESTRSGSLNLSIFPKQEQGPGPRRTNSLPQPKHSFLHHFNHRMRDFMKDMMRFRALKLTQLALSIYIAILTFADMGPPGGLRDTETGFIVDHASPERTANGLILVNGTERSIIANSTFQVACIGIARLTAWFMYPGEP